MRCHPATAELGLDWLDGFGKRWGKQYPTIAPMWRRAWEYVTPLFAFPPEIRKRCEFGTCATRR